MLIMKIAVSGNTVKRQASFQSVFNWGVCDVFEFAIMN